MTIALDATRAHGELDCMDAEAILQETALENSDLRARLGMAMQAREDTERLIDTLRLENDRLRSLLNDVSSKNAKVADERDSLAKQVFFANEELAAAEKDAVPAGTLLFATVSREDMVAEYRRISRITRGPLPPSVLEAVEAARDQITEAMAEAAREVLTSVLRREVRGRRRTRTRR